MTAGLTRHLSLAASEGALGQLTNALAVDWAPHGILVNVVAPGYIATDLTQELLADPNFEGWVKQRCPLGRWGTPDDVAWPVVFLASARIGFNDRTDHLRGRGWLSTF